MANLEARWNSLSPDPEKDVFQLFDPAHPLSFYIGRDTVGQQLLLLVTKEKPPASKQYKAIQFLTFKRTDGKWSMLFKLSSIELTPVFAIMCDDLIESSRDIENPKQPVAFLMKRFANWQRLLERGHTGLLEPFELRGLMGELIFMERFVIPLLGIEGAVRAWVGPVEADQDFQFGTHAWEVKSIYPDARTVQIASENQLSSASRAIELVAVCLEDRSDLTDEAFTPNDLVRTIRRVLEHDISVSELFEQKLASAGFVVRPEYESKIFFARAIDRYRVEGKFPRVIRESLTPGISHVAYELAMEPCKPYLVTPEIPSGGK